MADLLEGKRLRPVRRDTAVHGRVGQGRRRSVGGVQMGRGRFEPGWRWSVNVKPIAGTDSCQALHTGYVISGRMAVRMDDG